MRVTGIISLAVLTAVSLTALVSAREPTKQEFLAEVEKKLRATSERVGPAVACVVVSRSDRYPKAAGGDPPGKLGGYDPKKLNPARGEDRSLDLSDPKNIPDHGCACGVVIDPSGLVLTPYHVIDGATRIFVHLPGRAGSYADIHAADARYDLAVLKLITPPTGMTAIKFADVRLAAHNGQPATVYKDKLVVLLSSPPTTGFVLGAPSADLGCVRGVRPPPELDPMKNGRQSEQYYLFGQLLTFGSLLAHDPGSGAVTDGAPLLNLDGEMVGLTTATVALTTERGPHYAFPADDGFRRVVEVLRRGEEVEYGYLGVMGPYSVLGPDQKPIGVRFDSVIANGPADLAELNNRDIVTQVGGHPTTSYPELLLRIGSALAGEKVKLSVTRGGRARSVEVTLGKFKHDQPVIASVRPAPVYGLRVEYGSILGQRQQKPFPGETQNHAGVPPGVCVRELVADSPAATAFKKLGDRPERWIITHLNGAPVATPAEFYKAAKEQQTVRLTVRDPAESNSRDREVTFP